MGVKKVVVVLAIVVVLASYWLYAPLPDGYSSPSRRQFQAMIAAMKLMGVVANVGECLGFGSHVEITRSITTKLMKYRPIPDNDGIVTSETLFDGIPVRIYKPSDSQTETVPGIVCYHGGGGVYGSIDSGDSIARRLSKDTRSVVVSVGYRLAPEFPFPAALDDSLTATKYFLTNAAKFQVNPQRVAVSGDSSGGNLAATVSLKLRDEKFPIPIKLQVLINPATQALDFNLPSIIQNKDGPLLTRHMRAFFAAMNIDGNGNRIDAFYENRHVTKSYREKLAKTFLNLDKLPKEFLEGFQPVQNPDGDPEMWNEIKDKLLNPYYSPLVAENLENLPEAFVFLGNFDPLRDEGYLFGVRLREAGNKVTLYNVENGFHGMANFVGIYPEVEPHFAEIIRFINEKL